MYARTETKTARSRRTVPLPDFALEAVRDHQRRQEDERASRAEWSNEWDLVFTTADGAPLYGPNVTRHFQRLIERAELPPMTFHELRHSCASTLLAAGVPLPVISSVLGHSSIAITNDIYGHLTEELTRQAAVAMQGALEPRSELAGTPVGILPLRERPLRSGIA